MIKFRELNSSERTTISQNRGLTSYLSRLKSGNEPTPRSWLYESSSPEDIQKRVSSIIEKSCSEYPVIAEEDQSKWSKFGPQGGLDPFDSRLNVLSEYFAYLQDKPQALFATPKGTFAKAEAVRRLKLRPVNRPLAPETVVKRVAKDKKLNTNSGGPDFTKRTKPEVQERAIKDCKSGVGKDYPAILGSRSMRGKQRFIFMFPMSANLAEAQFTMPIQDHIRSLKLEFFAAGEGFSEVERVMTKLGNSGEVKVGTDHKGMDQHFTIHHAREVFDVVKHAFQHSYGEQLGHSLSYPFTCNILTCNGMIEHHHALASGSGGTNLSETIFKFIEFVYLLSNGIVEAGMALGDDGELFVRRDKGSDQEIAEMLVEQFEKEGLESQAEKQIVSQTHTHFLQRIFLDGYKSKEDPTKLGGVYPLSLATNSLVFPERFHDARKGSGEMFVIRCLMIAENAVNHPGFDEYMEFVVKGSEHFREFAQLQSSEVERQGEEAKTINNFVPTYNQEKMEKPLREFASYKKLLTIYG